MNRAAGEGRGGLAVSLAAAAPCELCAALWDRRVPDSALANAAGARARNGASCGAASCPKDLQRMISDITVKPPASGDARDPDFRNGLLHLRYEILPYMRCMLMPPSESWDAGSAR